jgi:ADP-ribosylglycohydrolase
MFGAIIGDIIGSVYERRPIKSKDFNITNPYCNFTDDTVTTIGIAYSILNNISYQEGLLKFCKKYPTVGYGKMFGRWTISNNPQPYNSFGNGSAMRVSPVSIAFKSIESVLNEAKETAKITHNHPLGIQGAQAAALAGYLALTGKSKAEIKTEIEKRYKNYNLSLSLNEIRPKYSFTVACDRTVPQSIICFLESSSYEDAIRNAVSLGGDSDTLACITGGIAEAYYKKIPTYLKEYAYSKLPEEMIDIVEKFYDKFKK